VDGGLLVGLVLVLGFALVSRRLGRWSITAPIVFMVAGFALTRSGVVDSDVSVEEIRVVAEATLVLALFDDASRVPVRALRQDAGLPARLLGIGLPLAMVAGTLAGALLFRGHSWFVLAALAAILAPTDAALGATIMDEPRIPERLRRLVNVESGLNDGLATPFVLFLLAGATAEESGTSVTQAAVSALQELAIAVVLGLVVGVVGARLLAWVRIRGWSDPRLEPVGVLAMAMLTYALALVTGGNGFVAAFVGGLAFGQARPRDGEDDELELTEELGTLLGFAVWLGFGVIVERLLPGVTPAMVGYAVLSLTVVRMVPTALALIGGGLPRDDVLLVGWLGPRGLASIIFAILSLEWLDGADAELVVGTVTTTVVLSVLAHGLSAGPLARRYAAAHPDGGSIETPPTTTGQA
jgi:NhaP-type Na+/H+ or K+/H+ antiporter